MENIEILNFITSVKLSENNNYATLPLSIEVEKLPLMFNMKMNFNLLGNNSDEVYYIMLEMVNMETKERALKFYETVVMSKLVEFHQFKIILTVSNSIRFSVY